MAVAAQSTHGTGWECWAFMLLGASLNQDGQDLVHKYPTLSPLCWGNSEACLAQFPVALCPRYQEEAHSSMNPEVTSFLSCLTFLLPYIEMLLFK